MKMVKIMGVGGVGGSTLEWGRLSGGDDGVL